ncbi:hypothetical protein [Maridesulfovibrio frigidus]|uniref:hypothetical protein n=1 Tax=Maridesulfovibrio frigidus TaxID=340956 RepID=UPI0004E15072|nr:hypothetical protein [Maridesulfovibrio frigidus]
MPRKVLIIDTSILCVFLKVPHMDTCGPENDKWNAERVEAKILEEKNNKTTFVLPMATLIECGNHITQAAGGCYEIAKALSSIIEQAANETTPWAAFTDQSSLWSKEQLLALVEDWPNHCSTLSIGDYTIKDVAEYYADMGTKVELLTGDAGLKAYEPSVTTVEPRRRQTRG